MDRRKFFGKLAGGVVGGAAVVVAGSKLSDLPKDPPVIDPVLDMQDIRYRVIDGRMWRWDPAYRDWMTFFPPPQNITSIAESMRRLPTPRTPMADYTGMTLTVWRKLPAREKLQRFGHRG